MLPTQGPLLPTPEQGKSVVVYFTSEHSFMVCTAQRLQAQMSAISNTVPLIYTILIHVSHTYMRFEWNTFDSNWNRGGISCDVHFAGHLRSKCAEQGGARTGIENRWFTHGVSSSGRAYQVVHKSQMSAFEVVGAFLIMRASRLASLRHCMLPRQSMYATNDVRKASVHYNRLWFITEPIPTCPRLHRDAP